MRRPCADREEKRVIHGKRHEAEEQLDPDNPNQRGLLAQPDSSGAEVWSATDLPGTGLGVIIEQGGCELGPRSQ